MDGLVAGRVGGQWADERARTKLLSGLTGSYEEILRGILGELGSGTADTPARAAKAILELTAGYEVEVDKLFTVFEGEGYDEMVAVSGIPFSSLCEHHMLPFTGTASVVYLPSEKIVGLSKIPRVVDAYARRFQNQERITMQIADALEANLQPRGVMVVLEAHHTCMSLRGVKSAGQMHTSVTRGMMRHDSKARDEAMRLIHR